MLAGTVTSVGGWLSERKKRIRDNRDADVAFWEKTIEAQNAYIEKLNAKIDAMELRYETQIQSLLAEVAELSAQLEQYEPRHLRKKPIHTPKPTPNA